MKMVGGFSPTHLKKYAIVKLDIISPGKGENLQKKMKPPLSEPLHPSPMDSGT